MKYSQEFEHTRQEALNRIMPYWAGQGAVSQIYKTHFLSEDIAQLFDYVVQVLERASIPLITYKDFTLVNIYSKFWRYSHGYCPPPPEDLTYPTTGLTLTFSLRRRYYDEYTEYSGNHLRYPMESYMWGTSTRNIEDYFTICVPYLKIRHCNIRAIMSLNISYLYNVLSSLTKCWVLKYHANPYLKNLWHNYNKFYRLPFPSLLNRYTVKHLPYSKFVWENATNLITLDYDAALFYFLCARQDVGLNNRTIGDRLYNVLFGQNSVTSYLKESIRLYNEDRESENLILMAALHGKECFGRDYYKKLQEKHYENILISEESALDIVLGEYS